jgi:hypothetical protein
MERKRFVSTRLSDDEMQAVAAYAARHKLGITEYIRAAALGELRDSSSRANNDMHGELRVLRERVDALQSTLVELVNTLKSSSRVPSFREYRARCVAEDIAKNKPNESVQDYLLRVATLYYAATGIWPDPCDEQRFGQIPSDFVYARWPTQPPK